MASCFAAMNPTIGHTLLQQLYCTSIQVHQRVPPDHSKGSHPRGLGRYAALAAEYFTAQLHPECPGTVNQQLLQQQQSLTFYHLLQSLGVVPSAGPRWWLHSCGRCCRCFVVFEGVPAPLTHQACENLPPVTCTQHTYMMCAQPTTVSYTEMGTESTPAIWQATVSLSIG
jgi:hypothetical protein